MAALCAAYTVVAIATTCSVDVPGAASRKLSKLRRAIGSPSPIGFGLFSKRHKIGQSAYVVLDAIQCTRAHENATLHALRTATKGSIEFGGTLSKSWAGIAAA